MKKMLNSLFFIDMYYMHAQLQVETKYFMRRQNNTGDLPLTEVRNEDDNLRNGESDEDPNDNGNSDINHDDGHPTFQDEVRLSTYWQRIGQLFFVPRIRRASQVGFTVMIAQQLCGVSATQ